MADQEVSQSEGGGKSAESGSSTQGSGGDPRADQSEALLGLMPSSASSSLLLEQVSITPPPPHASLQMDLMGGSQHPIQRPGRVNWRVAPSHSQRDFFKDLINKSRLMFNSKPQPPLPTENTGRSRLSIKTALRASHALLRPPGLLHPDPAGGPTEKVGVILPCFQTG